MKTIDEYPSSDMIAISYEKDLAIAIKLGFIKDYETNLYVRLRHPLVNKNIPDFKLVIYKQMYLSDSIPDNMYLIQQILVNIGKYIIKTELQTLLEI